MDTVVFAPGEGQGLETASAILKNGGLVAIPTETVYGLAALPYDEKGLDRIYEVKGRPEEKALIILLSDAEFAEKYCCWTEAAGKLAESFWPGALTIILKKKPGLPLRLTAGGDTVGVRIPNHDISRAVIRGAGGAVAAPSANISGRPSPTNAKMVMDDLGGAIDAVVDAGECSVGVPSTIVDMSGERPRVLRQGVITEAELLKALGE